MLGKYGYKKISPSNHWLKVSYADMDDSVGEEREPKRKRLGIITREEWEVGQQVFLKSI